MSILTIILNILLPPLGVFLVKGLGKDFIINLILTLIFWIPGVIHAFWVTSR
ncbi:MAG TPA: YqaE/Pmp3 family membrane protein [Flavobacteriaceae bacterium]|nr:YqaE/Pmp3 family membrane protein [Flavobacteriaceae bacterium]